MQVRLGTNYSSPFTVTNGIRQGGVLSPYLFAVYLDELSIRDEWSHIFQTPTPLLVHALRLLL